ncbi:hypothetical protein BpHYR1_016905 [Brachionus plicatilis]|uniref:Uncharacterized protein n=1 Tax=Brachionus plicatilis TaxID=10195 RepID=A0A3M7RGX7_BRAPC|nr:hypothetical protein BpHYR1_016905 [Brachionus plicatilis]
MPVGSKPILGIYFSIKQLSKHDCKIYNNYEVTAFFNGILKLMINSKNHFNSKIFVFSIHN